MNAGSIRGAGLCFGIIPVTPRVGVGAMMVDDVPSPCVKVCEFDPVIGLCRGCYRELDEIALWSQLATVQKRRILDRLDARRLRLQATDPG